MTVLEKTKIYPTKNGNKTCIYVVFQKKVNGSIIEEYCGLSKKQASWIKAYTKEVAHLQTRFAYYLDALYSAKEKLASFEESNYSTPLVEKNRRMIESKIEV